MIFRAVAACGNAVDAADDCIRRPDAVAVRSLAYAGVPRPRMRAAGDGRAAEAGRREIPHPALINTCLSAPQQRAEQLATFRRRAAGQT
jgi:plasmid stability protein